MSPAIERSRIQIPPTSSLPPPRPLLTASRVDQTVAARSASEAARSATTSMPMLEIIPVANMRVAQIPANTIDAFASAGAP